MTKTCSTCLRDFAPKEKFLTVETEKNEYTFCRSCVELGFTTLAKVKNRTPDQILLLAKFRKWLRPKVH